MKNYIHKTVCEDPLTTEEGYKFMDSNQELRPGIKLQYLCKGQLGASSMSYYHIPTDNVVLHFFKDRTTEIPYQSITLYGYEEDVSKIEKIIIENLKKI